LSSRSNGSIARFNKMVSCPRLAAVHTMKAPRRVANAKPRLRVVNVAAVLAQPANP